MKFYNKLSYLALCTAFLSSCVDLSVFPEGGTFTEEQKEEILKLDPAKLQSDVNGLSSGLIRSFAIEPIKGTFHWDFGYAAVCMHLDASGMDVPSEYSGYNWFNRSMRFVDRTQTDAISYFYWDLFYKHIKTANDLIKQIDGETEDATLKAYLGQAYASRAFDYLHLVQIYQFTYKGHETSPAIPIVTETTSSEVIANNPRASVQDVYALIIDDLTKAIGYLEGFSRSGKDMINLNVAYGLRARANLLMQNWSAAAADAQNALNGYTPLSIAEAQASGFNDISSGNWIWGNKISETNDVVKTGIVNFPSQMCSFTGNGYAPGYAGRYINNTLWKSIPDTDVRKGWWVNEDYYSPYVDYTWTTIYNGKEYGVKEWFGWQAPYLNVKFAPYQNTYDNPTNACDFPLMRAEEMILIQAEAEAMGGDPAKGKSTLESFIQTYRNPDYTCSASDAQGIQDEVWFHRRVELWGEGFSFFDMMRLKKPLVRAGTNFPATVSYDLPAESQIFLYLIPEEEVNVNNGISVSDNNPVAAVPSK